MSGDTNLLLPALAVHSSANTRSSDSLPFAAQHLVTCAVAAKQLVLQSCDGSKVQKRLPSNPMKARKLNRCTCTP
jgi:hypothetical protein